MSGPVFVQDARGTPLMPMAAAHARKLLQRAKARRIPHHAFTVIQLAQVVAEPALRPLILGVQVRDRSAGLVLIAEGTRTVFPLLRVVVDFPPGPSPCVWSHSVSGHLLDPRVRNRRARDTRSRQTDLAPAQVYQRVQRHIHIIVRVLGPLRLLAPISHLVVLSSVSVLPVVSSDLFELLQTHPACKGLHVIDGQVDEVITPAEAMVLLITGGVHASFNSSPVAIATCSRDRIERRLPAQEQSQSRLLDSLVQAPHKGNQVMGIVAAMHPGNRAVLRIPHLNGANNVIWQRIAIQRQHLHVVSTDPVLFLPVSPTRD